MQIIQAIVGDYYETWPIPECIKDQSILSVAILEPIGARLTINIFSEPKATTAGGQPSSSITKKQ
jgi:hypothetical protein